MPFDIKQHDSFTYVTDENGDFTSISPNVYYVLGYPPDDLLRKSFASLAARYSFGRSSALMYQLLQGRQSFRNLEIGLACSDGRTLETEVSGRPVIEYGLFRGYQGVVLAISEYRSSESQGPSERETELLLDLVCHDIQNNNQGQIWLLDFIMESLSPDSPVYKQAEKCKELVMGSSDLLRNAQKLQRISTGARTLEKVELSGVLAEVVGQFSNGTGRGVKINFAADGEYPVMANALLKDAFVNVIGNAIKHSTGSITIDVMTEKISIGRKTFCRVIVDDNGPGIPDEIKCQLFKSIERGDSGRKGMGLYIVRKLIEGYGGYVQAENRVQGDYRKGSRFIITLPMADL